VSFLPGADPGFRKWEGDGSVASLNAFKISFYWVVKSTIRVRWHCCPVHKRALVWHSFGKMNIVEKGATSDK